MDDDLADTVIGAGGSRSRQAGTLGAPDEDTLVRSRPRLSEAGTADPSAVDRPAQVDVPARPSSPAGGSFRFRVNGGEPLSTDVVTLIGRAPRVPRVSGASDPRLIAVPSPTHEVSGTHLEIRQQGSSVVVTDLRSTNGTVVILPQSDPMGLRPGESFVVSPGSVIDIGDGNLLELLAVDRLVPDDHLWRTAP